MLTDLYLRNLGVIAEARVRFAPGLNVVTGETGVGKTLLVSSLALLCGARASARLVAEGSDEASVEAVLDVAASSRLSDLGWEGGEELTLARRLGADGRSRAWLAGRLVPLSALSELGLVEIHGQGAGFALARGSAQLEAIDAMAGTQERLRDYRAALEQLKGLEDELGRLEAAGRDAARETELLSHQLAEIERAGLAPDEEASVEAELGRLEHVERLTEIAMQVLASTGAEGAAGQLAEAHRALETGARLDPGLGPLVSRLADLAAESSELTRDLRSWAEGLEGDPERVAALRERKGLIGTLKRRYGGTIPEILEAAEAARARLSELEGMGDRTTVLQRRIAELGAEVEALATELSERRLQAAAELTSLVAAELPALALPEAVFEVVCGPSGHTTSTGRDTVAFRFSASRRRTAEDIGKVASGGELSRAMIAVTLALAHRHAVPVLVFDEADQGIGGEAALELARRLARLGRSHQVLVVSHLPQIAAFADHHVVVRPGPDGVLVDTVTTQERLSEVSRMLAGVGSSSHARRHAAELMGLAATERECAATSGAGRGGATG